MPLTVLGIPGSLRKASFNRALLRAAVELAPPGVTIETADLTGIPLFNQDDEMNPPAAVAVLKARIRTSDGVLFSTPEYNYSIPGVLKNAIDWMSRPYGDNAWDGKPVAVMGASPGPHPEVMLGNAAQRFDADLNLVDEKSREVVARLIASLAALIRTLN